MQHSVTQQRRKAATRSARARKPSPGSKYITHEREHFAFAAALQSTALSGNRHSSTAPLGQNHSQVKLVHALQPTHKPPTEGAMAGLAGTAC